MTCTWCGGNEIKHDTQSIITAPLLSVKLGNEFITMMTASRYSECKCGLVFQEHRQSDEWYEWFYSSGTYRQTLGISQEEMDADELHRAYQITSWLKDKINISGLEHLDIGASNGFLVDRIEKELGSTCNVAIDLHQKYGMGFEVGDLSKCPFYLVSAIHVLEHVTDPIKELTTWAKMTSKYLLVEVPGLNTIGGPLRFAHLYYFPPELLKAKIIELGFDIVAMETEPNTRILAIKK